MAFSNGYIFGFSAAICVVCSVSVAGVSMSLKERQETNRIRDERRNILGALGLPGDGQPPYEGEAIDSAWNDYVEQVFVTPEGKPADDAQDLTGDGRLSDEDLRLALATTKETGGTPSLLGLYVRKENGQTRAVAVPVEGVGLWGPISGYLALDPKATQVVGATFFAPKETPGLGAEIMEPPFKGKWLGKKVVDANGATTPIRVQKSCTDDLEHCVDGVSGATITSRGVDEMVADALAWYDPFLTSLRKGG
jgi:Na+-transporting NADH:ubiquinone oxidoreductase subunit C